MTKTPLLSFLILTTTSLTLLPPSTIGSSVTLGPIDKQKHHTYEEMLGIMAETKRRCPEITHLYNLTGHPNTTAQGRKLPVIVMSKYPVEHRIGIPEFKYIANMHGNEVVGKELLLYLMEYLCDQYLGENLVVGRLLGRTRIHLLPSMNPDGWQTAYESYMGDGRGHEGVLGRENSQGIDLNRNFPNLDVMLFDNKTNDLNNNTTNHHLMQHFLQLHLEQSRPESEKEWAAETMMVMKWVLTTPFVLSANLHGGELVVNYPFDTHPNQSPTQYSPTPDDRLFNHLARLYARYHKIMDLPREVCGDGGQRFFEQGGVTNGADWYKVDGGMQDFNYLASNCFELTFELGCDKFPPGRDLPTYWTDNKEALIKFMWMVHTGLKGMIVDDVTNKGIPDAVVSVYHRNGSYINHDVTSAKDGDYWRLLDNGVYEVRVCADVRYSCDRKIVRVQNQLYQGARVVNFRLKRKHDLDEETEEEEVKELNELEDKLRRLYGA